MMGAEVAMSDLAYSVFVVHHIGCVLVGVTCLSTLAWFTWPAKRTRVHILAEMAKWRELEGKRS